VHDLAFPKQPPGPGFSTGPQDRPYLERGLLDILKAEHIAYIYPIDLFVNEIRQGNVIYIRNVGHLTAQGHHVVAEILNKQLWDIVEESRLNSHGIASGILERDRDKNWTSSR
jgi:hypothetical protein